MDTKAYLSTPSLLPDMENNLNHCGNKLMDVMDAIDHYIQGTIEESKRQVKIVEEQLKKSKENLKKAEEAYQRSLKTPSWNEKDRYYSPHQDAAKSRLDSAKSAVSRCEKKLEEIKRLKDELDCKFNDYYYEGGFMSPPGVDIRLRYIGDKHISNAVEKMFKIIEIVEEYQGYTIRSDEVLEVEEQHAEDTEKKVKDINSSQGDSKYKIGEQRIRSMTAEQQKEKFKEATNRIRNNQAYFHNNAANADVRCAGCGRAINNCICRERNNNN